MSLFSSRSGHYLGVDFGTQSIKAVELKVSKGRPYLTNYGWVNVTNIKEVPDAYDNDYAKRLSDALRELFSQMKPTARKAIVAIPSFNGLVMIVDFPRMSEKDVASAIKFESRKYIPASLDEVNVSWDVLDEEETEKDKENPTMKVLLVAAPKSEVQYYDSLFKDVPVVIDSLELESFSLARAIIGNTKGRFILVDMGAKTTNIVLVENGIVHISRSVDIGGSDMTNAIMQSLNITRERAVVLKEGGENFFTGATKVGFPSLNFVANEVKRVLDTQKSDVVESLVLCGGGSLLVGLPEYMAQLTGLKVTMGNPLSHVVYDENTSGKIKDLSSAFSVAIGLALRGIDEKGSH
ncbi:MAG: type IV pilus assembly protein PilM [Parcubacteria group bacterium]|jgi:type IV pilus assembly protein PilM